MLSTSMKTWTIFSDEAPYAAEAVGFAMLVFAHVMGLFHAAPILDKFVFILYYLLLVAADYSRDGRLHFLRTVAFSLVVVILIATLYRRAAEFM